MDQQDLARAAERPTDHDDRRKTIVRTLSIVGGIVAVAAIVAAAVPTVRSLLPEPSAGAAAYPTQSVPDGVSVTSSEGTELSDHFAGTPAEAFPKGAAGISLPPAKAVKGFTAAEVTASLKKVRAALIASRLDHEMIVKHKPAKFLAMLAPNNRKYVSTWFKDEGFSTVITWIDPAVKLHPKEAPRVSGRITYNSVKVDGIQTLRVTTNFVWVYAFEGPDRPIAAAHDEIEWEFTDPDDVRVGDRGTWLGEAEGWVTHMDCLASEKGLLRPARPELAPAVDPNETADPNDWLRPDYAFDGEGDCPSPSASASAKS